MPLTDTACRNAKATQSPRKLADGDGLYLLIKTVGKYWRWDYRHAGKRKTASFGVYPAVTLSEARARHAAARKVLEGGLDPMSVKKDEQQAERLAVRNSFKAIAEAWLLMRGPTWSKGHETKTRQLLARDIYPALGALPVSKITSARVLEMARLIESRGAYEMPRVALVTASQVFKYAIGLGHIETDPAQGMAAQLNPRPPVKHFAHVPHTHLSGLLTQLSIAGDTPTVLAVKLNMLTFIRGGELRWAEWSEFDIDGAIWTVPAGRMKGRVWHKLRGLAHIVPLSRQALDLLEQLRPLTGHQDLLFPGRDDPKVPLTGAAMNGVFHRLGFKGQQTVHGLRGLASTILNESGQFDERAIEAQLSHKERDQVKASYNHAQYLPERTRIMQWWADHLTHKEGLNVVPIGKVA